MEAELRNHLDNGSWKFIDRAQVPNRSNIVKFTWSHNQMVMQIQGKTVRVQGVGGYFSVPPRTVWGFVCLVSWIPCWDRRFLSLSLLQHSLAIRALVYTLGHGPM